MKKKTDGAKLELWKKRLSDAQAGYSDTLNAIRKNEALYDGTKEVDGNPNSAARPTKKATSMRNIICELIDAQVDVSIPYPKVTAMHEEDDELAQKIEDFLKNEVERMRLQTENDKDERITPTCGFDLFGVDWDSAQKTHTSNGALDVSIIHPKKFLPQPGVSEIADMDWYIVRYAMTKRKVKEQWGVDVSDEEEEDKTLREEGATEDLVTLNVAYYRAKDGIGKFSWVCDTVVEDLADYQARRLKRCTKCGQVMTGETCDYCGSTSYEIKTEEYETILQPIQTGAGVLQPYREVTKLMPTPNGIPVYQRTQEPTRVPYYKPDVYPIVMRRNIARDGRLSGDSDASRIRDQQNIMKKAMTRIDEKSGTAGSLVVLPESARIETNDKEMRIVYLDEPSKKSMIDVLNLQGDIAQDRACIEDAYAAARNILGITDSYLGRTDPTATSGKAKEFAAQQTAGRLESKKIMKKEAYSLLYEIMFKFFLAYADEPVEVIREDVNGKEYYPLSRWDFLKLDSAGEYYWDDEFIFSVDTASNLSTNRESMWQEATTQLEKGALGDPTDMRTLLLYWSIMDKLHYPLAKQIQEGLTQRMEDDQQAQMTQQTPNGYGTGDMGLPAYGPEGIY